MPKHLATHVACANPLVRDVLSSLSLMLVPTCFRTWAGADGRLAAKGRTTMLALMPMSSLIDRYCASAPVGAASSASCASPVPNRSHACFRNQRMTSALVAGSSRVCDRSLSSPGALEMKRPGS